MNKHYSTGDPHYDLVAAVFRQAMADARSGDASAAAWLAMVAPDVTATASHRGADGKPKRVYHKLNRMTETERLMEHG